MLRVSLVIPTYNEAQNIRPLVEEIEDIIDKESIDLEYIFVDDNSPDGTGKIAEEMKNQYPVKVIHRSGKLGLGSAVREGFKLSDRPYIGVMDADLSHDPIILNDLIKSLIDHDVTTGSRFADGSEVEKWDIVRKMISQTGVFLAGLITGIKDPLSGYFFFRKEVIEGVELKTKGYKILLEILVKGKYKKVKQIPFTFRMRRYSTSKLNAEEFILFIGQIMKYGIVKIFSGNKNNEMNFESTQKIDKENKEYWNRYWKENKNKETFFNTLVAIARKYYFAKAFARFIVDNYDIKGKTICEFGVGSGLTLSWLKKMGASHCVGIDYSEESITLAREENKNCEFILADAFATGLSENQFDLVYSLGMLEHYDKQKQSQLLAEKKRLAKECVFIEVPYDIFYFRWLFAINRMLGRTTTFSDEEMFTPRTFKNLGLRGQSKLMPTTFFLTIGHFENVDE